MVSFIVNLQSPLHPEYSATCLQVSLFKFLLSLSWNKSLMYSTTKNNCIFDASLKCCFYCEKTSNWSLWKTLCYHGAHGFCSFSHLATIWWVSKTEPITCTHLWAEPVVNLYFLIMPLSKTRPVGYTAIGDGVITHGQRGTNRPLVPWPITHFRCH